MGSFNTVCQISRRVLEYEDKSIVLFTALNSLEGMKSSSYIYNTDKYSPISFIFYTNYYDYGEHTLNKDFKKENKLAWKSLREFGFRILNVFSEDELDIIKSILDKDMYVGFEELFDFIRDSKGKLSNMSFDYFVVEELLKNYNQKTFKLYDRESNSYLKVNFYDEVYSYYENEFIDTINSQFNVIKSEIEIQNESLLDLKLAFMFSDFRVKYPIFPNHQAFSSINKLSNKLLYDLIVEDKTNIAGLVNNYFFSRTLSNLFLPYNVEIYGGQDSFSNLQAMKIKGELISLKNQIYSDYESGMDDLERLFPNLTPDDFNDSNLIKNLINDLDYETLINFYIGKEDYI